MPPLAPHVRQYDPVPIPEIRNVAVYLLSAVSAANLSRSPSDHFELQSFSVWPLRGLPPPRPLRSLHQPIGI